MFACCIYELKLNYAHCCGYETVLVSLFRKND